MEGGSSGGNAGGSGYGSSAPQNPVLPSTPATQPNLLVPLNEGGILRPLRASRLPSGELVWTPFAEFQITRQGLVEISAGPAAGHPNSTVVYGGGVQQIQFLGPVLVENPVDGMGPGPASPAAAGNTFASSSWSINAPPQAPSGSVPAPPCGVQSCNVPNCYQCLYQDRENLRQALDNLTIDFTIGNSIRQVMSRRLTEKDEELQRLQTKFSNMEAEFKDRLQKADAFYRNQFNRGALQPEFPSEEMFRKLKLELTYILLQLEFWFIRNGGTYGSLSRAIFESNGNGTDDPSQSGILKSKSELYYGSAMKTIGTLKRVVLELQRGPAYVKVQPSPATSTQTFGNGNRKRNAETQTEDQPGPSNLFAPFVRPKRFMEEPIMVPVVPFCKEEENAARTHGNAEREAAGGVDLLTGPTYGVKLELSQQPTE